MTAFSAFRTVIAIVATLLASSAMAQTADDLFNDNEVHDIWIHINAGDWERLRAAFMEDTFYPCDVEWRNLKVRNAACRSRGMGSRNGTKPGLRVDLDHYVTGQTFLGLESFVLDNLWQDPSMIKERLAMRLFARLGLPAPREAHARVYVGGARRYSGLYAVVEEIDQLFLRRYFDNDDGHLYEYRWIDDYGLEYLGAELEPYAARFEPRTHVNDSMFSLFAPVRDLISAVNEAREPDVEAELSRWLDVRALLQYLAAENYLAEWDGITGYAGVDNFYLHRAERTGLFRLLGWDKDLTFFWLEMPPWHNVDRNVLTRKIWSTPRLQAAYLRALLDAADAGAGLEREAVRAYEQIHAAALADPLKPYSDEEFEHATDEVRRFARERGDIVRGFVAGLGSTTYVRSAVAQTRHGQELPVVAVRP